MRFCIYCGEKLEDEDMFCPGCGAKLEPEKHNDTFEVEDHNDAQLETYDEYPEYDSEKTKKSKKIILSAFLIVIVFGTAGFLTAMLTDTQSGSHSADNSETVSTEQTAESSDTEKTEGTKVEIEECLYYVKNASEEYGKMYREADDTSEVETTLKMNDQILSSKRKNGYVFGEFQHEGKTGWIKVEALGRIAKPEEYDNAAKEEETYVNNSSYAKGVALHPVPDDNKVNLARISEGEEFVVQSIVDGYGFVRYETDNKGDIYGWYNMKYAELGTSSEYQPYKIGHQYKVAVKNLFSRYSPDKYDESNIISKDIGKGTLITVSDCKRVDGDIWVETDEGDWVCAREGNRVYLK